MKNLTHYLFGIIFFLFTISSCTITQEYHFNRNLSGTASTTIDMTALVEFMKSMDTTESVQSLDTLDKNFEEMAKQLKEVGAKNVEFGWKVDKKSILYIKYDFDNIESLNNIMSQSDITGNITKKTANNNTSRAEFSNNGRKKISYKAPDINKDSLFNESDIESMNEYFNFVTIFSFDRKIKTLISESYSISEDKKSILQKASMQEFISNENSQDFEVTLKGW